MVNFPAGIRRDGTKFVDSITLSVIIVALLSDNQWLQLSDGNASTSRIRH